MKYLVTVLIVCVFYAFSNYEHRDSYPVTRVKQDYDASFRSFKDELSSFHSLIQAKCTSEQIRSQHLSLRLAFKRLEYLLAHFDNPIIKQYLNGAPLPVTRYEAGQINIYNPVGLQVLDELVFEDDIDKKAVKDLLEQMLSKIEQIHAFERGRYINEQHILIAMRKQIIRITSLGITGFDTPGSLNALEEASTSLGQMHKSIKYFSTFVTHGNDMLFKTINATFSEAIACLQSAKSFESFERMHFIREFMNPLSAQLLVFHDQSNIPFMHKEQALEKGLHYKALHMFSENAFNPDAFTGYINTSENQALLKLGSFIFYDDILSYDKSMSCATCHLPDKAFTDGKALSITNHIQESTNRNTPTLINSVFAQRFFYDLRAQKLDNQIIEVFSNPNEFHTNFDLIESRLLQSPGYIKLIREAFPNEPGGALSIDRHIIVSAIVAYVQSLRSFNSTFDQYMRFEKDHIDQDIVKGFDLFMGKAACGTCHFAPLFSGLVPPDFDENETEVLGVPLSKQDTILDPDPGRIGNAWKHEQAPHYAHSFKTTSVRNVELTAPYMHNGIYETLEEVLEFYNHGGGAGMGIELDHQTLAADSLHLSTLEMSHIITFMKSLTDSEFEYIVPDTLPRFHNKKGRLSDLRRNKYSSSYSE